MSKFERLAPNDQAYIQRNIETLIQAIFEDHSIDRKLQEGFIKGFKELLVYQPTLEPYEISLTDDSDLNEILTYLNSFKSSKFAPKIKELITSTKDFLESYPTINETQESSIEKLYSKPYRSIKSMLRNPFTKKITTNILEKTLTDVITNPSRPDATIINNPLFKQIIGDLEFKEERDSTSKEHIPIEEEIFYDANEGIDQVISPKKTKNIYIDPEDHLVYFDAEEGPIKNSKPPEQKLTPQPIKTPESSEKITQIEFITKKELSFIDKIKNYTANFIHKLKDLLFAAFTQKKLQPQDNLKDQITLDTMDVKQTKDVIRNTKISTKVKEILDKKKKTNLVNKRITHSSIIKERF